MKTLEFEVKGMDCAECASHVQKALADLPQVDAAQVYLGAEKAIVSYAGEPPNDGSIIQAVSGAGYEAVFDTDSETNDLKSFSSYSVWFFVLIVLFVLAATLIGERFGLFSYLQSQIPWYLWLVLIIIGGWPVFQNVIRALLKGQIISHTLMSASVITAAVVGEWATALLIVAFMRIGDLIESKTTDKARQAVRKLKEIAPETARILKGEQEEKISIKEIMKGDLVIVRPGESIPVDGIVRDGRASVNQSAISGESMPLEKSEGMEVHAASILQSGMLIVETTAVGKGTTFGRIIQMVEEAEANRGEFQRLADRFSGYYLPIVAVIAFATYLIRRDLIAAASVMAVACSCSFSLATPMAMLATIGSSAQKGLLFKGGKYVESLNKADTIFIDKTGTLTIGRPVITNVIPLAGLKEVDLIQLCASAEQYSEHPLADAVLREARRQNIALLPAKKFDNVPGKGISAEVKGKNISISSRPVRGTKKIKAISDRLSRDGKTLLFMQVDRKDAGILAAEDILRSDTKQAVRTLREMGFEDIKLISGDNRSAAGKIAGALGIDFEGEMKPDEKIKAIKESQSRGHHVIMIGDGINDAPALAQADIGIAMGKSGSDIAVETSHITLLREDWSLIPEAIATAKKTMRVVQMNIIFTAAYNLIGLALAALGFLPPAIAAALQSIPDVGIMANSARLMRGNTK